MSERINHTNYEAWLLDRLEGRLSAEQEAALDAFLAAHPELAPIADDLPSISAAELPSFNKDLLKRDFPPKGMVSEASIDDHLVARLEKDLSPDQLLELEKFLYEHPEYARADRAYALTKLVPEAIAFAAKQELVRQLPPEGLVTKYTLEDHLVARLEGDLSERQERALQDHLKSDRQAQKEWQIMARTKISADPVIYPQKSSLKKGGRVIAISFQRTSVRLAAAASVAVLLGLALWSVLDGADRNPGTQLVQQQERTEVEQDPIGPKAADRLEPSVIGPTPSIAPLVDETPLIASAAENGSSAEVSQAVQQPRIERSVDREELQFAEHRKVLPSLDRPVAGPIDVTVTEVPVTFDQEEFAGVAGKEERSNSIGTLVASAVREKVLEQPSDEPRPLDRNDAVAALDKGLKAIGGEKAGLAVQRTKGGKIRNFNLRVGEFALTASTGH